MARPDHVMDFGTVRSASDWPRSDRANEIGGRAWRGGSVKTLQPCVCNIENVRFSHVRTPNRVQTAEDKGRMIDQHCVMKLVRRKAALCQIAKQLNPSTSPYRNIYQRPAIRAAASSSALATPYTHAAMQNRENPGKMSSLFRGAFPGCVCGGLLFIPRPFNKKSYSNG